MSTLAVTVIHFVLINQVRHTCQCLVRTMQWERYPTHVRDHTLKAYRPVLIQVCFCFIVHCARPFL